MIPRFCVIPDFKRVIPNQHIKYMVDTENVKDGKVYHNMKLVEAQRDIKITPWDGVAIHSPAFSRYLQDRVETDDRITSFIFRMPFAKGLSSEIDFERYCFEHDCPEITDIWGHKHDVTQLDMVLTASAWKAEKFFSSYGDYRDFEEYLYQCEKYGHSLVVTRWNEQAETEKIYTRANYQILQDLLLDKDDFLKLAEYSKEWGRMVAEGFTDTVFPFTGLTYRISDDGKVVSPGTSDPYLKALLKNPVAIGDPHIKKYVQSLAEKYLNEFCCGKLWLRGAFKFIVPDPIGLLQFMTGQEPAGSLKAGEMFSQNIVDGYFTGDCILERNPHIARSEHCVLTAVGGREKELIDYCGHLLNAVIINAWDVTLPRLSGADADGDIAFVLQGKDNPLFLKGIDRTLPTVINIDEKATAKAEKINSAALIHDFNFASDNRIGEYSNCATKWYNKTAPKHNHDGTEKNEEQKADFYRMCADNVNLIAIVNAKEIDSAKTHVKVNLPNYIQKKAGFYPYFMRYAGDYYAKQKDFSKAKSNMNELCFEMERFKNGLKWAKPKEDFDWHIYLNSNVEKDEDRYNALRAVYKQYVAMKRALSQERQAAFVEFERKWKRKNRLAGRTELPVPSHLFRYDQSLQYHKIDEAIVAMAKEAVPGDAERANYAVEICYSVPSRPKKFAWLVAGDAIARNIEQVQHKIPLEVHGSEYDFMYLGRKYMWATYPNYITPEEERSEDWWRNMYNLSLEEREDGKEYAVFRCCKCKAIVAETEYSGGDLEISLPDNCPVCGEDGDEIVALRGMGETK